MNSARVKEILASSDSIEVRFKGSPVWIESLDGDRAKVQAIDSKRRFEVMIHQLVEGKQM